MKNKLWFMMIILLLSLSACSSQDQKIAQTNSVSNPEIILATTTSTRDSGLLDELIPIFEEQTGYQVKMVAVGTGAALKMGEEGNADVLLVHAPTAELALVDKGFISQRLLIMHNDFVIVGPESDPAGIRGLASASDSLERIKNSQAIFISRGDDSGTHKKERSLWRSETGENSSVWYFESGQGMGETLRIASEKGGYTLTDRATFLAQKDKLSLEILLEADAALLNIYHVMVVNPEKWPETNTKGAEAFAVFMASNETQTLIKDFGVEQYGQPLFFPDAGKDEANLGL